MLDVTQRRHYWRIGYAYAVDAEEEEDSDDGEGETDPDVEEFRAKFRAKQGKKRPNCGGSKRAEG